MAEFDLVIRGGTIVDGSGAPRFTGDVAVQGGWIVQVGQVEGRGREEIDATGHLVTPGWVDVHTHFDGQVSWDPYLSPSCWHGVTTVVMGNCGVGFAPVKPHFGRRSLTASSAPAASSRWSLPERTRSPQHFPVGKSNGSR